MHTPQLLQNKFPKAKLVPGPKFRNSCCSLLGYQKLNHAQKIPYHLNHSYSLFNSVIQLLHGKLEKCSCTAKYLCGHSNITI